MVKLSTFSSCGYTSPEIETLEVQVSVPLAQSSSSVEEYTDGGLIDDLFNN